MSIGGAFNMFGAGVSDLFGASGAKATAEGDWRAAQSYNFASEIANENKNIAHLSTQIQERQTERKIAKTIGAQQAAEGGANVGPGGTSGDLLRESISQGALAKTMVATQGAINENAYEEQSVAYQAMRQSAMAASNAADKAARGMGIGAALNFVGGAFSLFL